MKQLLDPMGNLTTSSPRTIKGVPSAWRTPFGQLPSWAVSAVAIVAATIIFYLMVLIKQAELIDVPFESITNNSTNPYNFGVIFQDEIPILALLILLSTRPFFQRWITQNDLPYDNTLFFGIFAGCELLALVYYNSFSGENLSIGLVIVAVAGLYGGWRMGITLGFLSSVMRGIFNVFWDVANNDVNVIVNLGFWDLVEWFYLSDMTTLAPIWVGFVAGHIGYILMERRYSPGWVFLAGLPLHFFPSLFTFLVWDDPYRLESMPAILLVFSLALAGFALIVNNIRTVQTVRQAELIQFQLSQAELRALRAQINPHFLFNSLNTIRYFVRADQDKARQLLLDLSEVFQVALKAGDFVSLEDEIDFTKSYLALEQARLDERLNVSWFVQADDLYDIEVPTLILQPVVENAIVHGIAPKTEGGRIQIMVTRGMEHLILQVIDDGVGMPPARLRDITNLALTPDARDGSIGTYNIQSRLETLYGDQGSCRIESIEGRGTTVEIRIPLAGLKIGVADGRMTDDRQSE
ncbi:MAG: histidine kinase [Chloroflexota bacterium]